MRHRGAKFDPNTCTVEALQRQINFWTYMGGVLVGTLGRSAAGLGAQEFTRRGETPLRLPDGTPRSLDFIGIPYVIGGNSVLNGTGPFPVRQVFKTEVASLQRGGITRRWTVRQPEMGFVANVSGPLMEVSERVMQIDGKEVSCKTLGLAGHLALIDLEGTYPPQAAGPLLRARLEASGDAYERMLTETPVFEAFQKVRELNVSAESFRAA